MRFWIIISALVLSIAINPEVALYLDDELGISVGVAIGLGFVFDSVEFVKKISESKND